MPKIPAIAILSAAALVLSVASCSSPPSPTATPSPTAEAPVGTGDFTPDAAWFGEVEVGAADLAYYVESWENQECTMAKVIETDFNCSIHISGILEGIDTLGPLLADVVNVTTEAAEQVEGLRTAADVAPEAVSAASTFREQGCDFGATDSCTEVGDRLVAGGTALYAALSGWTAPAQ